jgi:hypothetical protein
MKQDASIFFQQNIKTKKKNERNNYLFIVHVISALICLLCKKWEDIFKIYSSPFLDEIIHFTLFMWEHRSSYLFQFDLGPEVTYSEIFSCV